MLWQAQHDGLNNSKVKSQSPVVPGFGFLLSLF